MGDDALSAENLDHLRREAALLNELSDHVEAVDPEEMVVSSEDEGPRPAR